MGINVNDLSVKGRISALILGVAYDDAIGATVEKHPGALRAVSLPLIWNGIAWGKASRQEMVATFKDMYDADVSPTLISKVTDAVKEHDCIVVKARHGGSVINKAVLLALGINTEGQKELLGMWMPSTGHGYRWTAV